MLSSVISAILVALFTWHLWRAGRAWRDYADVRSLRYAVQALLLFAGAIGLSLGAYAVNDPDNGTAMLQFSLGFMRSVLLIGGIYLLVSWRRR
jgi:hypothetical protein